jgi:hypothetical protein
MCKRTFFKHQLPQTYGPIPCDFFVPLQTLFIHRVGSRAHWALWAQLAAFAIASVTPHHMLDSSSTRPRFCYRYAYSESFGFIEEVTSSVVVTRICQLLKRRSYQPTSVSRRSKRGSSDLFVYGTLGQGFT